MYHHIMPMQSEEQSNKKAKNARRSEKMLEFFHRLISISGESNEQNTADQ